MSYSELHRTTTNGTKMTNFSADLAFTPDNELVELVWENGQIMMQGQSSRSRKSPSHTSPTSKAQEKDGGDAVAPKFEKLGTLDSALNNNNNISSLSGPSGHVGLCEDYDMVPWLSYPLDDDDTLQHDYSSEFFPELTGASLDSLSLQNNVVTIDKNSSNRQLVRDTHLVSVHSGANPEQRNASASRVMGVGPEPSRPRGSPLCSSPLQQCLASFPSFRSRDSDFIASNTNKAHESQCQDPALTGGQPNTKMQKQGLGATKPPLQPSKNMGSTNFSHFLRPTAPFKTNLQSSSSAANPRLSGVHRMTSIDKVSAPVSSNTVESMLIESPSGSTSVAGFRSQPVLLPGKVDLKPSVGKPPKKSLSADKSEAICRENSFRNTGLQDQALGQTSSFAGNTTIGRPDTVKDVEPAVASSSVCSGNNAGGASNDPKLTLKRKSRDVEDSEDHSEDVEEESVGVRKAATTRGGTGSRRTRAAEVHNLSERRRRDRINEKMRALQDLIPNCNKVDKASMLDEAIEYLKTLQFQLQIMSLGAGMYMPPLMLPTGMHAPPFSHMGVGMGMGMGMGVGFGMGMYDMSGGRPLIQVPPMHGMQFHCPPISSSLPMMAGCSPQMLGFPNQGIPMSMPCAPPYVPLSEGPSIKSVSVPDVSRTEALVEVPDSVPPFSSKDSITNTNLQMMTNTSDEYPQNQMPSQATIEGFEQSAVVATNDQTPHISTNGDLNSANGNETN